MESIILPISPQGQITIPKKWRDALLRAKTNNQVQLVRTSETTFIIQLPPEIDQWLDSIRGTAQNLYGDPLKYQQKLNEENS